MTASNGTITKRQRAGTPRSRNGCANCRRRKVKCDERQPSCRRCEVAHQNCEGCGPHLSAVESVAGASNFTHQLDLIPITKFELPVGIPGGPQRRKALHYFATNAVHDVEGFISRTFWQDTILQRSFHDRAVQEALIAVSYAHLDYTTTTELSDAACASYSNATRKLRQLLDLEQSTQAKITTLLCCCLFFIFEVMHGKAATATIHLHHALQLLRSWRMTSASWPPEGLTPQTKIDFVAVLLAVGRLELALSLSSTTYSAGSLCEAILSEHMDLTPVVSNDTRQVEPFTSLIVAEQQLHLLLRTAQKFVLVNQSEDDSPSQDLAEQKLRLIDRLKGWLDMLAKFEEATTPHREQVHSAEMIQRMRLLARCVLHSLQSLFVRNQKPHIVTAPLDLEVKVLHHQRSLAQTTETAMMLSSRDIDSATTLAHITDDILHVDAMKLIHMTNQTQALRAS